MLSLFAARTFSDIVSMQLIERRLIPADAEIWDLEYARELRIPRNADPGPVIDLVQRIAENCGMKAEHAGYLQNQNGDQLVSIELRIDFVPQLLGLMTDSEWRGRPLERAVNAANERAAYHAEQKTWAAYKAMQNVAGGE
jgi:hypothetical protein